MGNATTRTSKILEQWDRVNGLVKQVGELEPDERELFLHLAQLQPAQQPKPQRRKRAGKKAGKSARASAIAQQLSERHQRPAADACVALVDDNGGLMECGQGPDANVHHKSTEPGYHEFVSPETATASGAGVGD